MSRSRRHFSSCAGMARSATSWGWGPSERVQRTGRALLSITRSLDARRRAVADARARAPAHAGSRRAGGGPLAACASRATQYVRLWVWGRIPDSQAAVRSSGGLDATRRAMDPVSLSRAGCELRRRRRRASRSSCGIDARAWLGARGGRSGAASLDPDAASSADPVHARVRTNTTDQTCQQWRGLGSCG